MLTSLRELGILSARYAEEEGIITSSVAVPVSIPVKVEIQDKSNKPISTIVSAPVPVVTNPIQSVPVKNSSPSLSSVSSSSLPSSPVISQSPPGSAGDCVYPANALSILAQRASLSASDQLQQIGLSFLSVNPAAYNTQQGIFVQTPMGLTRLSAVPAAMLATTPRFVAAPSHVEPMSSIPASRLRKPFHKRRPAHMDKNMLVCHCCGRKDTPEWRKGPDGPATLCNACGLQWAKKVRGQRNSAPTSSSSSTTKAAVALDSSIASDKETSSSSTKSDVAQAL